MTTLLGGLKVAQCRRGLEFGRSCWVKYGFLGYQCLMDLGEAQKNHTIIQKYLVAAVFSEKLVEPRSVEVASIMLNRAQVKEEDAFSME